MSGFYPQRDLDGMLRLNQQNRQTLNGLQTNQRLFVQRWIELFSRETLLPLRCRPYWPAKLEVERDSLPREDFHLPIVNDELSQCRFTPFEELDFAQLTVEPGRFAERLGLALISLGFNDRFLFHAAWKMLGSEAQSFEERIHSLRTWWRDNASMRSTSVAFPVKEVGTRHAFGVPLRFIRWHMFSDDVKKHIIEHTQWQKQFGAWIHEDRYFACIDVTAVDSNGAAHLALEHFIRHQTLGIGARKKPSSIDYERPIVIDLQQRPDGRISSIKYEPYYYKWTDRLGRDFPKHIVSACDRNKDFARFFEGYLRAADALRAHDPERAMDGLAAGIDIPFKSVPTTWGSYRTFIDKAAKLWALDWFRIYFRYIINYCIVVQDRDKISIFGRERRPEQLFDIMIDEIRWREIFRQIHWEEIVNYHRSLAIDQMSSMAGEIRFRHRLATWDLARALRARHALFHRGEPVEDFHAVTVLMEAFEMLLGLWVFALDAGISFAELVAKAEQAYQGRARFRAFPLPLRRFVSHGWWIQPSARRVLGVDAETDARTVGFEHRA
jgi:hypothetical protein